jgi:hypothetical protein
MYSRTLYDPDRGLDVSKSNQGLAAIAILLVIIAAFAFAPQRDPSKVVAGIPCSVIPETEISAVLGAPMRLLPTTGSVCRYVSTSGDVQRTVLVVAHQGTPRSYSVVVIAPRTDAAVVAADQARLTNLVRGAQAIARY